MVSISARADDNAHTRLEPADRDERVRAALRVARRPAGRHPQLPRRAPELEAKRLGHDADDGVGQAVDLDGPADERSVGAVAAGPQPVAQHHHAIVPGLLFRGQERAADQRPHPEHGEEARGHAQAGDLLGARRRSSGCSRGPRNRRVARLSKLRLRACQSRKLGSETMFRLVGSETPPFQTVINRSASGNDNGCSSVALTTLNIVVLAPMPSASVSTATAVNAGAATPHPQGVADVGEQAVHGSSLETCGAATRPGARL